MTQTHSLAGQTALVTGGGTGVGLGTARRLLEHGATVTIAARRLELLDEVAKSFRQEIPGAEVRTIRCDITIEDDVSAAVQAACDARGHLDIAVANAGSGSLGPILVSRPEEWLEILNLNVVGTMLTIKHAALAMKDSGGGSIVAISSPAAAQALANLGPYSPSKAGLEMLVHVAALELGPLGVRVNAIRPGLVVQDMLAVILKVPGMREGLEALTPLRLEGSGEEIGDAVIFLSSPSAAWITGQILGVDGGMTIPQGQSFEPAARAALGNDVIDGRTSR
jgi:NAD(P)-dependent dehydrogenase (short-subunit alcohol dehydrogenase family)